MIPKISEERRRMVRGIVLNHTDMSEKMNKVLFEHYSLNADIKLCRGRRSMENKKRIAHEFLEEYLHDSSLHGVKYLGNLPIKSSILGKIFWALIMICSFVFLIWMINTFWTRYTADPIRTVVESFQSPIFESPFPAITLCPLIPPLIETRKKLLERLDLPRNINNETAMFLLRYVSAFANERVLSGKKHMDKLNVLLKLNNMALIDLIKFLRPCEDMIESCWWDGVQQNCSDLFKISYTSSGICCSFNYLLEEYIATNRSTKTTDIPEFLTTAFFGSTSGLAVVFHRDLFVENDGTGRTIRYSTNAAGVLVFVHHPLEYIGAIATTHLMQAQQELRIAVTPYLKKKLAGYYRRNFYNELDPHCADDKAKLKYLPVYRYANCFVSCSIEVVFQICGCLPYYYQPVAIKHSLKICDSKNSDCLYANANNIRVIKNFRDENITCKCHTPCRNVYYETQTSVGQLNRQDYNVSPAHKNLTRTQAILRVFMNSETYTITDTIPIADELYLLASVGGIFSLFVGCSFISAVEIFYFIGLFLHSYCISKKWK